VFPSGTTNKYRVRAKNGVGNGVYSAISNVLVDQVPTYMNAPNLVPEADITPNSMKLTWNGITLDTENGRDPVIFYELSWLNDETE